MNSPKVVVSLGFITFFSIILTACGGGGSSNNNSNNNTPSPPVIQTVLLPQGAVNTQYLVNGKNVVLSATGGTGTYTWSIASGSLPPGLSLDPTTSVISGTPTTDACSGTAMPSSNPCNYPFTAKVTDSAGLSGTKDLSIYIEGVVVVSATCGNSSAPNVCPSGSVNVPYSAQLSASGGLLPYTWALTSTSGPLPSGLTLYPATGLISGTPTANTNFNCPSNPAFVVQVTDSETSPGIPAVGTSPFCFNIMTIASTSLPSGILNVPYNTTLTVAGGFAGTNGYTWAITSGTLPPGLSLDPSTCIATKSLNCSVKGTPTKVGAYPMTVQVTDGEKSSQPAVATANLTINVYQSKLVITTTSLPAGVMNVPYSVGMQATGGVPPYTWCVLETNGTCDNGAGILPAGLTMDSSSGVISGTPTAQGTTAFLVQVQDSGSPQQTVTSGQLAITINPPLGNSNLNGNYVFNFSGYNSGTLVLMAGGFVADGNGGITSGVLDYNNGSGETGGSQPVPQHVIPAQSSYSIQPNGLGTMTIVTDFPATYRFNVVVRSDGSGNLIQSDKASPQAYGSGTILKHFPITDWPLCGSFVAVGLSGLDSSLAGRYAGAGAFQFDPNTCVDAENGVMDANDGGSTSSATFTGAFNQYDPNTSRGIAGLTLQPGGRHFYAFYLASSSNHKQNQLILVSTDPVSQPANLTLWTALPQASSALFGPNNWNNLALNGSAVTQLDARDTNGAADVTAGLFVGTGALADTCQNNKKDKATFTFDQNQGGTCNGGTCGSQPQSSQGTYCVDKSTGRVTLSSFTGQFGQFPPVFYLVGANQAFVVGTDPAVTSGYLEQQAGSPFTIASLSGPYAGGTVAPVTSAVTNAVSWLFAAGNGNINGTEDTSGPGGPGTMDFNYTYTVDSTGRIIVQQSGATIGIAYVISPTKFLVLPATDPNPALSVFGQ